MRTIILYLNFLYSFFLFVIINIVFDIYKLASPFGTFTTSSVDALRRAVLCHIFSGLSWDFKLETSRFPLFKQLSETLTIFNIK